MDQRIGALRRDDVPGEYDLLAGQINYQIPACVRGCPVEHFQFHAVDLEILLVLGDNLRGEMIGGRSATATGSQSSLLLFLVVLVGNDRDASWERCQPVDVIAVAVREDDGGYRLWRDFSDVIQEFFSARWRGLGVN